MAGCPYLDKKPSMWSTEDYVCAVSGKRIDNSHVNRLCKDEWIGGKGWEKCPLYQSSKKGW